MRQQLAVYGSYDLPFGKGKQFVQGANQATDLLIGGYQLSRRHQLVRRLAVHVSYNECGNNVNTTPNPATSGGCVPNATGHMKTSLTKFVANSAGTGSRRFYQAQTTNVTTDPGTGIFTNPGLDHYRQRGSQHLPRTDVLLDRHGDHQGIHHLGER